MLVICHHCQVVCVTQAHSTCLFSYMGKRGQKPCHACQSNTNAQHFHKLPRSARTFRHRSAPAVVGSLRPRVAARRPAQRPLGGGVEQRVLLRAGKRSALVRAVIYVTGVAAQRVHAGRVIFSNTSLKDRSWDRSWEIRLCQNAACQHV